jgi:hypothetical protein
MRSRLIGINAIEAMKILERAWARLEVQEGEGTVILHPPELTYEEFTDNPVVQWLFAGHFPPPFTNEAVAYEAYMFYTTHRKENSHGTRRNATA